MSARVAVVIVNYESGNDTASALQSLIRSERRPDVLIVVDNASHDDSLTQAERVYPELLVIRNDKNVGFAKAVNQGMELARRQSATHIWLFNPDARAATETLGLLLAAAEQYPKSLFSPLIFDADGKVWFAGGDISWMRMRATHRRTVTDFPHDFLTGCALFLPISAFEEVGGLDERFFLYYEDADYSVRAREKGYALRVVASARVDHAEVSQSNPEKTYFLVYSGLLFFFKHATRVKRLYLRIYVTIRRLKNWLDCLLWGGKEAVSVRQAYGDFFRKT